MSRRAPAMRSRAISQSAWAPTSPSPRAFYLAVKGLRAFRDAAPVLSATPSQTGVGHVDVVPECVGRCSRRFRLRLLPVHSAFSSSATATLESASLKTRDALAQKLRLSRHALGGGGGLFRPVQRSVASLVHLRDSAADCADAGGLLTTESRDLADERRGLERYSGRCRPWSPRHAVRVSPHCRPVARCRI